LNEYTRCVVAVAGGVSLSVLDDFEGKPGRERASAVSRRASSRVFVGLDPRLWVGDEEPSVPVAKVEGSILPMNVHRLLFVVVGESVVSFGADASAVSSFERVARDECRL
jgi:hypothetical protein